MSRWVKMAGELVRRLVRFRDQEMSANAAAGTQVPAVDHFFRDQVARPAAAFSVPLVNNGEAASE